MILVTSIRNVLPYSEIDGVVQPIDTEVGAEFTGIECITENNGENELVVILLPRGTHNNVPCQNTYLLADAIREE